MENNDLAARTLEFLGEATQLALQGGVRRFRENCEQMTGQSLSVATETIKTDPGFLATVNLLSQLWVVGGLDTPLSGLFSAFGVPLSRPAESPETLLSSLLFAHMLIADEELGVFVQVVFDAACKSGSTFYCDPLETVLCRNLARLKVLKLPIAPPSASGSPT